MTFFKLLLQFTVRGLIIIPSLLDAATLKWSVGSTESLSVPPSEFYKADVPGAAPLDIARGRKYPPLEYADNIEFLRKTENCFFVYRAKFPRVKTTPSERLYFRAESIDYRFDIKLNGKKIHEQEGMFTPVDIDITDIVADENEIEVVVYPAPKSRGEKAVFKNAGEYRSQAERSFKPPVSYGWDWNPRAIDAGICGDAYLEIRNESHISDVYFKATLNDALDEAKISMKAAGKNLSGTFYKWQMKDSDGAKVAEGCGKFSCDSTEVLDCASIEKPRLWWTHDHGEPHLYSIELEHIDKDGKTLTKTESKIGIRKLKMVLNSGAYSLNPYTRPAFPMQIELNNRKIFAKGSNWVNPELFYGTVSDERYGKLLGLAKEANFNILRCWGGAPVNKESFYDLCDKLGIIVWQEFPLACNNYPDSPDYLKTLKTEATSIVSRLRKHVCLALCSGGNELFQLWSGMNDQSLALRTLNSICLQLNPETPFLPTSPLAGVMHGPYAFIHHDKTMVEYFSTKKFVAYTEYGVPSISPIETIKKVIPADELWPIKKTPAWIAHHGFDAFGEDGWLRLEQMKSFFEKYDSLEDVVEKSNFLQCRGYKAIFEEARRQKPYCSMAINWCYNDSWRTVANNSIVAYPDICKPAYYAVKESCRPTLASAQFSKFAWESGEEFFAKLTLLNDSYKKIAPLKINAYLRIDGKKTRIGQWDCPAPKPNENVEGGKMGIKIPQTEAERFEFLLEVEEHPEMNSSYWFILKKREEKKTKEL